MIFDGPAGANPSWSRQANIGRAQPAKAFSSEQIQFKRREEHNRIARSRREQSCDNARELMDWRAYREREKTEQRKAEDEFDYENLMVAAEEHYSKYNTN